MACACDSRQITAWIQNELDLCESGYVWQQNLCCVALRLATKDLKPKVEKEKCVWWKLDPNYPRNYRRDVVRPNLKNSTLTRESDSFEDGGDLNFQEQI